MKYLTTYIRLQGEGETSLLLQQYACRGIPVCFVCICACNVKNEEAGRRFTGQLLSWCRGFPWHKAVRSRKKWMGLAEKELAEIARESTADIACSDMTRQGLLPQSIRAKWKILLCLGEEAMILGNGQEAYLLGTSLGRGIVRRMNGSFRGVLEPGAGILLVPEGAVKPGEENKLGEALRLVGMETEEQANRHLREFAKKAEGNFRTAVLVMTKEGDNE